MQKQKNFFGRTLVALRDLVQTGGDRSHHHLTKSALLITLLLFGVSTSVVAQTVFTPGFLKETFYSPISGGLDGFTGDASFPGSPVATYWWNSYGPYASGNNQGDTFGEAVTGYVIPPVTGNYEFYLRSDDPGELFISTDDKAANLGASPIALQSGCCNGFTSTEDGTLSSAPIALKAGQKYYIQALHVEGGGDDYIQIGWRTPNDAALNIPPAGPIPAAYIGVDAPTAGASVQITTQPVNATGGENSTVSFTVGYTSAWNSAVPSVPRANLGTPPTYGLLTSLQTQDPDAATNAAIVWFKNGVAIPGQSKATYTTPLLTSADNGAKYTAQVSVPGAVATSGAATVTVTKDTSLPSIVSVSGDASFTSVTIVFNKPVTAASAGTKTNYTADGGLTISAATVVDPFTVRLTTSSQTEGKTYNLTVNNITDTTLTANKISANTKVSLQSDVFTPGVLREDFFTPVAGGLAGFVADSRFPTAANIIGSPSATYWWNNYGPYSAGNNQGDSYGEIVSGYVIPPVTGNYEFYLRSDDPGELFISTDDKVANLGTTPIALQAGCCNAFTSTEDGTLSSAPISLKAGQKYYIQALHVEGGGDDYIQIGWRTPKDPDLTTPPTGPIPAAYIGSEAPPSGASVTLTQAPANTSLPANASASFTVGYTATWNSTVPSVSRANLTTPPTYALFTSSQTQDANAVTNASIVWFKNGVPIEGESTASLSTPPLTLADNGAKYKVQVSVPGAVATSAEITLTVVVDNVPPTIVSADATPAVNSTLSQVTVKFSEPVPAAGSAVAANYAMSGGVTVTAAKLVDPVTVQLTTSPQAEDTDYTLTVNNVADLAGNKIVANTAVKLHSWKLVSNRSVAFFYNNIGGTPVDGLTADPTFPNSPSTVLYFNQLEYGSENGNAGWNNSFGDNYGGMMKAWLIPTQTGTYDFFIRSDDASRLFLSQDATFPDPTTATPIAEEAGCCNPFEEPGAAQTTATPISLTAGKKYGILVLHKEGGGGDGVAVGWRAGGATNPVAGSLPSISSQVWYYAPATAAAPAGQPTDLGQVVNGYQDDFTAATRNTNWVAVGPGGDAYVQTNGVLQVSVSHGDPNHLLYMAPGASNSVQEVLARIRVVAFGPANDPDRGGIAVGVITNLPTHLTDWSGVNINLRDNADLTGPNRHFRMLDDLRSWGPQLNTVWTNNVWYWMRLRMDPKSDGTNDYFGKVWLADGSTAEPSDWQMKWQDAGGTSPVVKPLHAGFAGITGCSADGLAQTEVDYILIKSANLPSITVNFAAQGPAINAPVLGRIIPAGKNVIMNWFGGTLQSSTTVTGVWANVVNTPSPHTNAVGTTGAKFFRINQ